MAASSHRHAGVVEAERTDRAAREPAEPVFAAGHIGPADAIV